MSKLKSAVAKMVDASPLTQTRFKQVTIPVTFSKPWILWSVIYVTITSELHDVINAVAQSNARQCILLKGGYDKPINAQKGWQKSIYDEIGKLPSGREF